MLEVNSGMSKSSYSELLMKHTKRASLAKMLAEVVMTSMYMYKVVLEPTSVVKSLPLLKALRASLADPD